jgi:hypothetical protein
MISPQIEDAKVRHNPFKVGFEQGCSALDKVGRKRTGLVGKLEATDSSFGKYRISVQLTSWIFHDVEIALGMTTTQGCEKNRGANGKCI